uniref:Uncharacterized protein n=1 Tax=Heterosigma akashiwo TaxID=2829 RepID=A0A6S9EIG4_HETAK
MVPFQSGFSGRPISNGVRYSMMQTSIDRNTARPCGPAHSAYLSPYSAANTMAYTGTTFFPSRESNILLCSRGGGSSFGEDSPTKIARNKVNGILVCLIVCTLTISNVAIVSGVYDDQTTKPSNVQLLKVAAVPGLYSALASFAVFKAYQGKNLARWGSWWWWCLFLALPSWLGASFVLAVKLFLNENSFVLMENSELFSTKPWILTIPVYIVFVVIEIVLAVAITCAYGIMMFSVGAFVVGFLGIFKKIGGKVGRAVSIVGMGFGALLAFFSDRPFFKRG